jgi:hypothetical protein
MNERLSTGVVAAMLLLCTTHFARATEPRGERLHGSSETMLNLIPDPVQRELRIVAPFIQWVTLHAERLAGMDLGVHLSGWGGFDLANALFPGFAAGDLSLAHLKYRDAKHGSQITLGRQYLLLGLARAEHFDGLHFAQDLPRGFRVEVFGGAHAGPRLTYQAGDWLAGGRLSYRIGDRLTAGVSFLQAREREELRRELVGADVVLRPKEWLEIGAGALYDIIGYHLAQLDLFATFYPHKGVRLSVDWRRIVPVALLDKTSIFSVFSDSVRNEAGGDVAIRLHARVNLIADAHWLQYDEGDSGYRTGLGARVDWAASGHPGMLTVRAGRWRDSTSGYTELRAAARQTFARGFFASVDLLGFFYDTGSAREDLSFGVTTAVGYEIGKRWRAIVAFEGGVTPQFERRAQVLGKLEYQFARMF